MTNNPASSETLSLSLQEAADVLGVSPKLVLRIVHRETDAIPTVNISGEMRFNVVELRRWMAHNWDRDAFHGAV